MRKKNSNKEMNTEEVKEQEMAKKTGTEAVAEEGTVENNEEVKEKSEVEIMTDKYNEMNDKYLRLYSEFENFRKRTAKEKLDLYKTAGEDIINALLPVKDDFERAIKSMTDSVEIKDLKKGVDLIHQKFVLTMKNQGLKEIDSAIGKEFDINFHEAITKIPAPKKELKGKIIDEVEKGYLLNEKVIRYTKVVIGE